MSDSPNHSKKLAKVQYNTQQEREVAEMSGRRRRDLDLRKKGGYDLAGSNVGTSYSAERVL
jgi:hypothetical protein